MKKLPTTLSALHYTSHSLYFHIIDTDYDITFLEPETPNEIIRNITTNKSITSKLYILL